MDSSFVNMKIDNDKDTWEFDNQTQRSVEKSLERDFDKIEYPSMPKLQRICNSKVSFKDGPKTPAFLRRQS